MPAATRQRLGVLAMSNAYEARQQALDLIMQLDDTDLEIFLEAVKSGYFKQDHTETELRAYIENARRQAAKNGGCLQ